MNIRNHGLKNRDNCEIWGYNSRLDCIQAGIATIKLRYLDEWTERYRAIAAYYTTEFGSLVHTPQENDDESPVYHRYMIRSENRDDLQAYLTEHGVETKVNYPIPIHLQDIGKSMGHKIGDFPETERAANEILSLPIYPELSDTEVEYVVEQVKIGVGSLIPH